MDHGARAMNQGWMRIREAAILLGVSTSTVRRRIDAGEFRGRTGESGRREVFIPKKLRDQHADLLVHDEVPAQALRGTGLGTEKLVDSCSDAAPETADNSASSRDETAGAPTHEMLKRYEKLAGGSLMLAEQRSKELRAHVDHAYEQLAHARHQLRRCRRVAWAGWGTMAGVFVLGLALSVTLGFRLSEAKARVAVQERATRQAQLQHEQLVTRLGKLSPTPTTQTARPTHATTRTPEPAEPRPVLLPGGVTGSPTVTD